MEILLALALGGLAGYLAGAARVTAQVRRGRLVRKAGAALAPLLPEAGPARSLADIFANRIRVRLGGITYELPVLPRAANRRWLESLEGQLAATAAAYQAAATDPAQVVPLLLGEAGVSYELLLSYDQAHILPSIDEIDEIATDAEILRAVMEVWQAANPKAAGEAAARAMSTSSPGHSTSSAASTAGAPTTSSAS